jgi:CDGSH-type Zn-finger protein
VECFSGSAHVIMEFAGREENQVKANPKRDNRNK